ncbi:MAG: transposase [Methylococcales bacterium]|nr:transposase [Methylococcales bacterium]
MDDMGIASCAPIKPAHPPSMIVTGGGANSVEVLAFYWINTVLGNVKTAMHGSYHAFRPKHLPRYPAEFEYRFNRRFKLDALVPRLAHAGTVVKTG